MRGKADSDSERNKEYSEMVKGLNSGSPDDIISRHLEMWRRDYRSLSGKNFLNDKVIDVYMKLISERNTRDGLLKVYPLTTHAYSWLEQDYDLNFAQ